MHSIFCSPLRYTQGRGAALSLADELHTLGREGPVLIVGSATPLARLGEDWRASLDAAGFASGRYEFGGECSLDEIAKIGEAGRTLGARVLVSAGGGKVMDAGRAAADDLGIPVMNCPTVASSDAPTSAVSVIYEPDGQFREYRFYGTNPDLVLVDTQVIAEAPTRFLVAGMGDGLSTWFEARTAAAAHRKTTRGGSSTRAALALAKLCFETLLEHGVAALRACEENAVTTSLEAIVEANTLLSGLGFESSGLAAAHSVHNGLTVADGTHHYLHGEKVSFGVLTQLVLEGAPESELHDVLRFQSAVGLPSTLGDVGLPEVSSELLQRIAERAVAEGETIHNEPFAVSASDVADAIRAADAIGRAWKSRG